MNWHILDTEKVFELTDSSRQGLSQESVQQKQSVQGMNVIAESKKKPAWKMFITQFREFMILVLIGVAVISGVVGELTDTIIILIIVFLNAILGFAQEYRAEKAIEALKKMAALNANVIRGGNIRTVPSEDLVPGDVVRLEAGNVVPADIRLFEAYGVKADESCLTGESVTVDKISMTLLQEDLLLGDRTNMLYKTTLLTSGRALGIVVSTGMNTEIGKIARLLETEDVTTPLQKRMADFGKKISYLILFICVLLFVVGLLRGEDPVNMLLVSISLAVAAIPEALPALITIALALGAKRLVKVNALIRKLPAVETLGSVTFICTDKTGTLTLNKMKVTAMQGNPSVTDQISKLSMLELSMVLNHDAKIDHQNKWTGDSTEVALVEHIAISQTTKGLVDLQNQYKRIAEIPFDSERKCMTTIHLLKNHYMVICKGAAESIAERVQDKKDKEIILEKANELAEEGMRVIVYAYRLLDVLPQPFAYESVEKDLIYSGMAGMIDPPRPEVTMAIADCKNAGIRPVMITGDHPATASAIARKIGILDENQLVITGKELQKMTDQELAGKVDSIRVYARVSPEQKLKIIRAMQEKNHFVAMTGDGVNDAPSLKSANIGIAMGINGTDVSKEAAHMILLDDNFSTIVKAIREGRRIYDNIRKFVKYIMTCNSAELWTIFLAPFLGLPIPLLPIHILWINLVTDGLPGLALANEKAEHNIMKRPPRQSNESLFSGGIAYHILWVGLLMAGITLGAQAWAYENGNTHWQTMVFTILSFSQIGHVLAIRGESEFLYQRGIFSNRPMLIAALLTFFLQLIVIYLPAANTIFKTQALTFSELILCLILSSIVFHAVEFEKWILNSRRKKQSY